jgi:6-phosphogluconolactonase
MPAFTRRDFLIVTGVAGAAVLFARLGADRLLKSPSSAPLTSLETLMPSSSSLVFASGYAAANQPGIQAFMFDETRGTLIPHGSFAGILNPSFIVIHPNGQWMYAVSETGQASDGIPGGVCALSFERESFSARLLNQQPSGGDWPCHLQLDATGKWLIATNYGSGNAAIYPLQPDGSLGEMTDFVQHHGKGPNAARQEASHAHSSIFTPDNRFVIIADLGIDQLVIYQFDTSKGKLHPHASASTRPGAGPRHLIFHPNGKYLYAANELDNSVTLYDYDAVQGNMTERQCISTLPSDSPESTVADIHISATGKRLYVSNRGHDSIAVYDMDTDGNLKLVSFEPSGGNCPRNFALAPGGRFLLVANQNSNEVCVLPVHDGMEEALGAPVNRVAVTGASCIQFL